MSLRLSYFLLYFGFTLLIAALLVAGGFIDG